MQDLEKLIDAIKFTYKNTTAVRFLSDVHGNIFWKGGRGVDQKTTIIFPGGPPSNNLEEKYSAVLINEKPCFVRGTVLSYEDDGAVLWTVYTMKNIMNELGATDSYVDFCYMISDVKRNIERILFENEEAVARDPRRRNSVPIINQNKACYSLLRFVEGVNTLFTVIFKRDVNNTTINLIEIINELTENCTKELKDKSYNIVTYSKTVDVHSALIKANHYYLRLTLMTFVNKLLSCCKGTEHTINVTFDGYRLVIAFTFDHDICQYIDSIYGDFSVYCAKMYILRLGGSIIEKDNQLFVTIPQYLPTAFHSSGMEMEYEGVRFKHLTGMYLYDIKHKGEGTDNIDKTVCYTR